MPFLLISLTNLYKVIAWHHSDVVSHTGNEVISSKIYKEGYVSKYKAQHVLHRVDLIIVLTIVTEQDHCMNHFSGHRDTTMW